MKEISDNDYRAFELMNEQRALRKKGRISEVEASAPYGDVKELFHANTSALMRNKDRIERIDFALEAYDNGEDILVAMLSDPREEKSTRDTLNFHHTAWARQAMAQTLAVQSAKTSNAKLMNMSAGQLAAQNAIDAFARAAEHFQKEQK